MSELSEGELQSAIDALGPGEKIDDSMPFFLAGQKLIRNNERALARMALLDFYLNEMNERMEDLES